MYLNVSLHSFTLLIFLFTSLTYTSYLYAEAERDPMSAGHAVVAAATAAVDKTRTAGTANRPQPPIGFIAK